MQLREVLGARLSTKVEVECVVRSVGRITKVGHVTKVEARVVDKSWVHGLLMAGWGYEVCRELTASVGCVVRAAATVSEWDGRSLNCRSLSRVEAPDTLRWYRGLGPSGKAVRAREMLGSKGAVPVRGHLEHWLPKRHILVRASLEDADIATDVFDSRKAARSFRAAAACIKAGYLKCRARCIVKALASEKQPLAPGLVTRCVNKILEAVVPKSVWGSAANSRAARRAVDRLLRSDIAGELRMKDVRLDAKVLAFRATPSAIEAFALWYARLAVAVVRAFFHVTVAQDSCCPLFFLARDWRRLERREVGSAEHLALATEAFVGKKPRLRLAPKTMAGESFRIIQMDCSTPALRDVFLCLRLETNLNKTLAGFGGRGSPHDRLLRALKPSTTGREVVQIDVRRCFDGMDQERVFHVAVGALAHSEYYVARSRVASVEPPGRRVTREALVEELRRFVFSHTVRQGRRVFRQIQGIPQGAIVSSLLCDLYYGALETERPPLAIRYVDDALAVCESRAQASKVVDAYGDAVHPTKSSATFPHPRTTTMSSELAFCGIGIDVATLETFKPIDPPPIFKRRVVADVARVQPKLHALLRTRMHAVYFAVNSRARALDNLAAAFEHAATKLGPHLRKTGSLRGTGVLQKAAKFAYGCYRRSHRKFDRETHLRLADFYRHAELSFFK